MKIPSTTEDKPYIKFSYDISGKLSLTTCSGWWGGKNGGFVSSNGSEGNTCLPKDLKSYLKAFNEKRAKTIEKEISDLQRKLKKIRNQKEFL